MKNRFFRRVKLDHELNAVAQDGVFSGRLENISLGGLFIKTQKNISPGDRIEIEIPLIHSFTAKLIAIRNESQGVAFIFDNLDPKNFWTLQSFIISAN
jgi:hypothetical protein